MTQDFKVETVSFEKTKIEEWSKKHPHHQNWPVTYILTNKTAVYVGETRSAGARLVQHIQGEAKSTLTDAHVIVDETFNKSACLDLESMLIQYFSGDGFFAVENRNTGIANSEYFDRPSYQKKFEGIFNYLKDNEKLFKKSIPEIVNSDMFKYSPYKSLNQDQTIAIFDIMEGILADLASPSADDSNSIPKPVVIMGGPGTGKTVIAVFMMKLIRDIADHDPTNFNDDDSIFSEFFTSDNKVLFQEKRIGLLIPQQSLRKSMEKIFLKVPGLEEDMVVTAFEVGESKQKFDVLIVDESHRLTQMANQSSGVLNRRYSDISAELGISDKTNPTQLDWILKQCRIPILLLDQQQSIRPADLPLKDTSEILDEASRNGRLYELASQMRISADKDFVKYVRDTLSETPPLSREDFGQYDVRFFDNFGAMRSAIRERDKEFGLSRLVAGFAWKWVSRQERSVNDIELDGETLKWNSTPTDWINSKNALDEMGSIHTVQGYDLNYVGVVIGSDLGYNSKSSSIVFNREHYHDTKGKENNRKQNKNYTDDEILEYVKNAYSVLMTRGIRGMYLYVCDPELREYLRNYYGIPQR